MNAIQKAASDALEIWDGACNVHGLARALVEANDAAMKCGGKPGKEMAYAPSRLIMAQLSFLYGQGGGDYVGVEADMAYCKAYLEASEVAS